MADFANAHLTLQCALTDRWHAGIGFAKRNHPLDLKEPSGSMCSVQACWGLHFGCMAAPKNQWILSTGRDLDGLEFVHRHWKQDLLVAAVPGSRPGQSTGHDPDALVPVRAHRKKCLRSMTGPAVSRNTLTGISISFMLQGLTQREDPLQLGTFASLGKSFL